MRILPTHSEAHPDRPSEHPRGSARRGQGRGHPQPRNEPFGTPCVFLCTTFHIRVYTAPVPDSKPSETRLHLKFSPIFVGRLRRYAEAHGMKLNAVVKRAFEALEDHEGALASVQPKMLAKGRNDDTW